MIQFRPRHLAPLAATTLLLSTVTACGEDYDPCWIDPDVMAEEIFMTSTTQQTGGTWEVGETVTSRSSTYDQVTAEIHEEDDLSCLYTLQKESMYGDRKDVLRLALIPDPDPEAFDEEIARVAAESTRDNFVEEYRDETIVYDQHNGRLMVDDRLYLATYQSSTLVLGMNGRDTAPVMRYIAGTRAGTDVSGYAAWLDEEVERAEQAAAAAQAERGEQDYAQGYATGLEDGELEAIGEMFYERSLYDRSEEWLQGYEEGKAEGLASAPAQAGFDEFADMSLDVEEEFGEFFSDSPGPFDQGAQPIEIATDPHAEGHDWGQGDGYWHGADQAHFSPDPAPWNPYTEDPEREEFILGYEEGYAQGYREGWLGVGHPEDELPEEVR